MAKKRRPPNTKYPASITSTALHIPNARREPFRKSLEQIPFLGYEVERLADGRTICITKPGGKNPFGHMRAHDFMVWIYDAKAGTAWRISHKEIKQDIQRKLRASRAKGRRVIWALRQVHRGKDPSSVLGLPKMTALDAGLPGEPVDAILKAYKWIFGQEDCNYPTGEGRDMAMEGIRRLVRARRRKRAR